eukprot:1330333-Pyramimonas_sp.AAC.2
MRLATIARATTFCEMCAKPFANLLVATLTCSTFGRFLLILNLARLGPGRQLSGPGNAGQRSELLKRERPVDHR